MTPAAIARDAADEAAARWQEGPNVLALLFAHPDTSAITTVDARGEYFDHRSGDVWDLFFPGYYRGSSDGALERRAGAKPIGDNHLANWFFHPGDFNQFRRDVERFCDGRWRYSGGTDLVVACGWLPTRGKPYVDWRTTVSGSITDEMTGVKTLSLGEVVERISRDVELALDSPNFGLGDIGARDDLSESRTAVREFMVNTLAGIIAALGAKALGS